MLTTIKISNGYRTAAEIEEMVEAFERCTLPRAEWTHAAYLTVALWYLNSNAPRSARRLMRDSIKRYDFESNIAAAQPNGYNETLTVFWLAVVNGYRKRYGKIYPLVELANRLVERFADRNLPYRIYSHERLFSPTAKKVWVAPDKFIQDRRLKGEIIL